MQGTCTMGGCMNGMCGKVGQPCCGGKVGCTDAFTDCFKDVCSPCGHKGESCCPNNVCDVGRICATDDVIAGNFRCY
jgi:hypothetical protein